MEPKLKTTIPMNRKGRIMANIRYFRTIIIMLVFISIAPSIFAQNNPAPAKPRLGMNLAGPADGNTELPFVDVFRMSRPWISQ